MALGGTGRRHPRRPSLIKSSLLTGYGFVGDGHLFQRALEAAEPLKDGTT
jgi:hypothetical protein